MGYILFILMVLGIKSRALCMQDKHSTTELHPQSMGYILNVTRL
jgi:hypothetical protein